MTRSPSRFDLRFISRPFDPARKRFYFFQSRNSTAGDFRILNTCWFHQYGDGPKYIQLPERQNIKVPAGKNVLGEDAFFSKIIGLPVLEETLRIKVGVKKKLVDVYGDLVSREPIYVSDRAKQLFERIDPGAFTFAPCKVTAGKGQEVGPYWICALNRIVPEFDEEKSIFINDGPDWQKLVTGRYTDISSADAFDIHMKADMPDSYQAFWLLQLYNPIFSEVIVDAWRAAKMTGLEFTPLQTPTKKEEKTPYKFLTMIYYYEWGREYWEGKI